MKAPYQSRAYFDLLGDVDARLGGLTKLAESGDVAQDDAANENQGGWGTSLWITRVPCGQVKIWKNGLRNADIPNWNASDQPIHGSELSSPRTPSPRSQRCPSGRQADWPQGGPGWMLIRSCCAWAESTANPQQLT